ncbi:hypothetical protein [Ottowia thiooxydans]|uniref:Uncharacterized protein n=1 Tax=Ottowia thiooxydans TaxID=219182 RepID=A0ABV2Q7Q0_9BURK
MKKIFKYIIFAVISIFHLHAVGAGWVDSASFNRYVGWACQVGNENPIGIHIWRDDGIFLGGGNAPNLRESAVANACGTETPNHGFDITLNIPPAMVDNRVHGVKVFMVFDGKSELIANSPVNVVFGVYDKNLDKPSIEGAVVGRDLDMKGFGKYGHLGIWDGSHVIEMLNEGGKNKVKRSSWEDFIGRTKVWPIAYPKIPEGGGVFRGGDFKVAGCFGVSCLSKGSALPTGPNIEGVYTTLSPREAVVKRAYQIYLIGSAYTITAHIEKVFPGKVTYTYSHCNPYGKGGGNCPMRVVVNPVTGKYRCDSLVLDAFATSVIPNWGSSVDAEYLIFNDRGYKAWRQRMELLVDHLKVKTPERLMADFRSYQW